MVSLTFMEIAETDIGGCCFIAGAPHMAKSVKSVSRKRVWRRITSFYFFFQNDHKKYRSFPRAEKETVAENMF